MQTKISFIATFWRNRLTKNFTRTVNFGTSMKRFRKRQFFVVLLQQFEVGFFNSKFHWVHVNSIEQQRHRLINVTVSLIDRSGSTTIQGVITKDLLIHNCWGHSSSLFWKSLIVRINPEKET